MSLAVTSVGTRRLLDPVLAVVFPSRCPACGDSVTQPTRGPLCVQCWGALPKHEHPTCRCGFSLPEGLRGLCGRCRRGRTPFAAGVSLGPFEGSLRILIHELKYKGHRRVAARLAEALVAEEAIAELLSEGALVVPVPLHPRRARLRGFNQSELLARELAARRGLEIACGVLVRHTDTPSQTGLSAAGRRRNVAGAFAVGEARRVRDRVVVLVDDVFTTGATAMACTRALRASGATQVRLVTAARVS
jgi:ComF family protein